MTRISLKIITVFLFFILYTFSTASVLAAEKVAYKGPRPMKKIFDSKGQADKQEAPKVSYYYDPMGKTDPFKPFLAKPEASQEKRKRKPRTYLETLDLSQLQLIAVIVGPKGNWAMVKDSKGLGHVIKKGIAIGSRGGVVDRITEEGVNIREEYKDFRGKIRSREIVKKLPSLQ